MILTYPDNFKGDLKNFKEPFNHDLYMTNKSTPIKLLNDPKIVQS